MHRLSAGLFFALGISFFAAYLLLKNGIEVTNAAWWLQRGDLPLALTGLLYGGFSVYRSLVQEKRHSLSLALSIAIPALLLFVAALVLNFWEVLPVEQGERILS